MSEYKVEVKVKNNLIIKKIHDEGFGTPIEFCRISNLSYGRLMELINFKISPLDKEGNFTSFVYKLCDLLVCQPSDLFTEKQTKMRLSTNIARYDVSENNITRMLGNPQAEQYFLEDLVIKEQKIKFTKEMLSKITERERFVLTKIYGLDGKDRALLEEVANLLDVTRERIRQIEAKALKKLRTIYGANEGYTSYRSKLDPDFIN